MFFLAVGDVWGVLKSATRSAEGVGVCLGRAAKGVRDNCSFLRSLSLLTCVLPSGTSARETAS